MQQPTLKSVRVRTTRDALLIFYAVARRVLPMITRRLDAEERRAIVPGNVYIWEERCANAEITGLGMERWTDGISWSASRIAQEFLFYRQRDSDQDSNHSSAQWAHIMKRRDPRFGTPANPRSEADRLIKQTYSVHVSLPEDRARQIIRKWHLTAYFSQATLDSLTTVDMLPGVGDIVVPQGWFRNARASKSKQGEPAPEDDGSAPFQDSWANNETSYSGFKSEFVLEGVSGAQDDPSRQPSAAPLNRASRMGYQSPGAGAYRAQQAASAYQVHHPTMSDTGLEIFRDASPFTQSSSSSSELGSSPRPVSAPLSPPAFQSPPVPYGRRSEGSERDLVPLSFLKTLQPPVRDAMAEDCLRRLSNASLAGVHTPPQPWSDPVPAHSSR